jgi:hypothetical protein
MLHFLRVFWLNTLLIENYNPQLIPPISVTCVLRISIRIQVVCLCIAVKIPSPLTKHNCPLLTCVPVLKLLKVILALYE